MNALGICNQEQDYRVHHHFGFRFPSHESGRDLGIRWMKLNEHLRAFGVPSSSSSHGCLLLFAKEGIILAQPQERLVTPKAFQPS